MKAARVLILTGIGLGFLVLTMFAVKALSKRESVNRSATPELDSAVAPTTPADARLQMAQRMIAQAEHKPDGYNLLASAYMQKARETSDFGFNARAEAALARSSEIAPQNYDAVKLRAKLLLTYHRFNEALDVARQAQALRPDDHDVYGAITDAQVELGDYAGAIAAAQKMVDLRPDSSSYARVAYLRSLYGDTEGAIQAMTVAVKAADPNDPEGMAWCRVHLGDELMNAGRRSEAERAYDEALYIFPDYPLVLAAKARARIAFGDTDKAVELYQRAEARVPLPDVANALGNLYSRLGRTTEAKQQYELVEFVEHASAAASTYTRQLAVFWADRDRNLNQALEIAERERTVRQDIYTCDALAWCLFKNGRAKEAKSSIDEALRLGTRDARLFYHAGMIYNEIGDRQRAGRYLRLALETNPNFDVLQVDLARQALAAIESGRGSRPGFSAASIHPKSWR